MSLPTLLLSYTSSVMPQRKPTVREGWSRCRKDPGGICDGKVMHGKETVFNTSPGTLCCLVGWTDSTIVLHWIQSESQQYKVFMGTQMADIEELVGLDNWRYVPSEVNPANDITCGKYLVDFIKPNRWSCFLHQLPTDWPQVLPLNPHSHWL